MTHKSRFVALAAVAQLSLTAQSAFAQTPPAPASQEEIVELPLFTVSSSSDRGYRAGNSVSATRVDTAIKNLPFAVNAFTSEFITDIGARDLFDIAQFAPGLTGAGREFNGGNTVYQIRGFDQSPQRNGFIGALESYIDTAGITRVEVVKGPASVLYGQVAPGGTVNYITKRPVEKSFVELNGQGGTDHFWRYSIDLNQPLVGKKLLFRFNAAYENALEYVDRAKGRTAVILPSLLWKPSDRISVQLDYQHFERRENPSYNFLPNMTLTGLNRVLSFGPDASNVNRAFTTALVDDGFLGYFPLPRAFNYGSSNDYRHTNNEFLNAEITMRAGSNWNIRANLNWNKASSNHKLTGLGTVALTVPTALVVPSGFTHPSIQAYGTNPVPAALINGLYYAELLLNDPSVAVSGPLAAPSAILQRRARYQQTASHGTSFQAEAAGSYRFGSDIKFKPLFGVYRQESTANGRLRERGNNFTAWNFASAATNPVLSPSLYNTDFDIETLPYGTGSNQRVESSDQAAYAVLNTSFFRETLHTVVGARYNDVESQSTNRVSGLASSKFTDTALTPQAGLGYKIRQDLMVYTSYSESFRQNPNFLRVDNVTTTTPQKSTSSKGYELGVKADFFGGRVSTTIAAFQIEQKDRVVTFNRIDPVTGTTVGNDLQGSIDISEGFEFEVTLSPLDNWQIYLSGSNIDITVDEVSEAALLPTVGTRPEASVKHLYNLWTRYSFRNGPLNGFWIGGGFNHTGDKVQRLQNQNLILPSYTLLNASVGYDWKIGATEYTANLSWKNITDEEYFPANQQQGLPDRFVLSITARF